MIEFNIELTSASVNKYPLPDVLRAMSDRGTSVLLNWGEDNNLWECSWITGGKRYTGFSRFPQVAVWDCIKNWERKS